MMSYEYVKVAFYSISLKKLRTSGIFSGNKELLISLGEMQQIFSVPGSQ